MNTNKNQLNSGAHIQIAKGPFDYGAPIGPSDIHINLGSKNKIVQIPGEVSSSVRSDQSELERQEFHFQSEFGSNFLDESMAGVINKPSESPSKSKRKEQDRFSGFFDDDSSIMVSNEMSPNNVSGSHKKIKRNAKELPIAADYKETNNRMSETDFSNFFGNIYILIKFR